MLVAVAALAGLWVFERERRRSGLPHNTLDAGMAGVVAGLAGAKLVWAIEHADRAVPFLDQLMSRGGLSWFGGFAVINCLPSIFAGGRPRSSERRTAEVRWLFEAE